MIDFTKPTPRPVGLRASFVEMEVGGQMAVSMNEYHRCSVTNAASLAGGEIGGKFSVHLDWENKRFIVTRKK